MLIYTEVPHEYVSWGVDLFDGRYNPYPRPETAIETVVLRLISDNVIPDAAAFNKLCEMKPIPANLTSFR